MATTQYVKPDLPMSSLTWVGEESLNINPNEGSIVAIAAVADWGPMGTDPKSGTSPGGTALYENLKVFEGIHGQNTTPARTAVVGAFMGMASSMGGGAGAVAFFRLGTSAAAVSTLTVKNTAGSPVDALKLDALYKGTRGDSIAYVNELDPMDVTKHRVRILFRGSTVENYSYTIGDVTQLALLINARSIYVKATMLVTGTALAINAGTPLAGGNNGASVTATEFTEAQAAFSMKNFSVFAPAALVDSAVKVQLAGWQRASAAAQRPFRLVFGGAAGESVADGITELTSNPTLRDEQIVRVCGGTWYDETLNAQLSMAELAPRFAGILAARGETSALTNAPLGGLTPVGSSAPTEADRVVARDQGLTVLKSVAFSDAEVAVSQGVTTFIDRSKPAKPYEHLSEPRIVGILNRIQRYLAGWGEENIVGRRTVTDDTRAEVRKEVLKTVKQLEEVGLADPGSVYVSVEPPPENEPALKDTIPYELGFKPTPTANYVIGVGKLRV